MVIWPSGRRRCNEVAFRKGVGSNPTVIIIFFIFYQRTRRFFIFVELDIEMEIEHINHLSRSIGQTLTSQEQSNVEIGLIKRSATEKLMNLKFWGKITGTQADYIIAVGLIKSNDYPTKKFFFWYDSLSSETSFLTRS